MAVNANSSPRPVEQLRPHLALLAGAVSGGAALLAGAAAIVFPLTYQKAGAEFPLWVIPAGLILLAAAISGLQLVKMNVWAQQVLLAFWLLVATVSLTAGVALTLQGSTPSWWAGRTSLQLALAVLVPLAVSLAAAGLVASASVPLSRLRYSTMVILSTAAAVAVLLVANLIAQGQGNYLRRDVQWLGQYGLSERSKKFLKAVNEPVTLTSLYATSEANAASPERASRVWELLTEIHDLNPRIEIARATTDAERAELLSRVAQQARLRAPAHVKLLELFRAESPKLIQQLGDQERQWKQLAGGSYLDLWGIAGQIADLLKGLTQEQEEFALRLTKDLSGLADYAKLTDDVRGLCDHEKETLSAVDQKLKVLAKLPAAVAANRAAAGAKLDEAVKAIRDAVRTLGPAPAGASRPASGPSDPLKRFIAAMQVAADKTLAAAQALDEIAGPENARYIRASSAWLIGDQGASEFSLTPRYNISLAYRDLADGLAQQKMLAEGLLQVGTQEYQAKAVQGLYEGLSKTVESVSGLTADAKKAIDRLAAVDKPTAEIFKQVNEGKYLQGQIAQITKFAEDAAKLPALPVSTLAADLAEENTVLVETADKTEAVRFDQMWPARVRAQGPEAATAGEQRVFNGDSAVSAKILAMTQKPCATVILTYMQVPQQMAQMGAEMGMTPQVLEELQTRLRQANFRVKTWDMSASEAPADAVDPNDPSLPKVLLLLPPPNLPPMMARPDMPGVFGPKQIAVLRRMIDSGEAAAAIFLAQFQPPMGPFAPPTRYGWNDYLAPDWGIEVRSNYLIVPAERDETGTKFQLSASRLRYLPLSTFTDQPIGKPLQGQRVFWSFPVPVTQTQERPPGVTVQPLLAVPAYWTSTWATSDLERIQQQFNEVGSYVAPDYEHGDMAPPFDVALAATRQAEPNQGVGPARVVVLGMGGSFVDSYVQSPVFTLKEKNVISTEDPPKADLDVIVNSAYWLCGREDYIASGPVQVQPIRRITETTRRLLWGLCVIGLPAVLLGAGGLVLLLRRR